MVLETYPHVNNESSFRLMILLSTSSLLNFFIRWMIQGLFSFTDYFVLCAEDFYISLRCAPFVILLNSPQTDEEEHPSLMKDNVIFDWHWRRLARDFVQEGTISFVDIDIPRGLKPGFFTSSWLCSSDSGQFPLPLLDTAFAGFLCNLISKKNLILPGSHSNCMLSILNTISILK